MQQVDNIPKPPPVYPHAWREIINGSIEENFASIAQGTLNNLISPDFVPPPEHIQFLLYLTLNPSIYNARTPEQPLAILSRLLSTHSPSSCAHSIPYHPSSASHDLRKISDISPPYLDWDYKRSELHKNVWRCMRKCKEEGIWELLWSDPKVGNQDNKGTTGRSRASDGKRKRQSVALAESGDDDDEDKHDRVVSERGWDLLGWLVELWEVDRDSQHDDMPYSPIFLKQIARPYGDLQRNDASAVFSILKCAITPARASSAQDDMAANLDARHRRDIAARLLCLLLDTAQPRTTQDKTQTRTPFHPPSLASSLVYLFRSFPIQAILELVKIVRRIESANQPHPPGQAQTASRENVSSPLKVSDDKRGRSSFNNRSSSRALAHVLTLCIEDLVGIRASKNEERRSLVTAFKRQQQLRGVQTKDKDKDRDKGSTDGQHPHHNQAQGDFQNIGYMDVPTTEYLYRGILPLCLSKSSTSNSRERQSDSSSSDTKGRSEEEGLERLVQLKISLVSICTALLSRPESDMSLRQRQSQARPAPKSLRIGAEQVIDMERKTSGSGDSQQEVEHHLSVDVDVDVDGPGDGHGDGEGDADVEVEGKPLGSLRLGSLRDDKEWWAKIEQSVAPSVDPVVETDDKKAYEGERKPKNDDEDEDDEGQNKDGQREEAKAKLRILGELLKHSIRSSLLLL
ncbi:hypothetical protein IAU59_006897 [Kwoniella sp. CBS 9459]